MDNDTTMTWNYREFPNSDWGISTVPLEGLSSLMADFWAQQTTLALGQRKRSVISALLKQEKLRMGAMHVPGQYGRVSITWGIAVVVGTRPSGAPGGGGGRTWPATGCLGGMSDLSPPETQ